MSQRLLVIIFSVGLVAAVGVSSIISSSITSSMIASATLTGPAGADGADGRDGADGATGPQGIPGVDGQDGAPGATGSGKPGANGANGANGAQGAPGIPGVPGAPGQDAVTTPPVTTSTGATAAAPLTWTDSTTYASVTAPAGTYAVSYTFTGASAVVISGGGPSNSYVYCNLRDNASFTLSTNFVADGAPHDVANSGVVSITAPTTFTVSCYISYGMGGYPVDALASWADLTITATPLS